LIVYRDALLKSGLPPLFFLSGNSLGTVDKFRRRKLKNEFIIALNQVCSERNLPQDVVLEAIEAALVSAYRRKFGPQPNIVAQVDLETGQSFIYKEKQVVEVVEDDRLQILPDKARQHDPEVSLGETILIDSTPKDFGRIAAQTAKQVILQRIREAERDALFNSYADREGELVHGTVQSVTPKGVTINLGRTEASLPRNQQIPRERYRVNQRLRTYLLEVRKTNRGPQIIVSRSHRSMLRRLLELEVPEIFNGTVEIKAIAREAGSRSKVAVAAVQEGIDPVGSCVGMRGIRIQNIVHELSGEKVDVVAWDPDMATFIANALSPARVSNVLLDESSGSGRTATVIVPDDQLSLSIGKEGQNARLAAKLTNWRIDIKSISEAAEEAMRQEKERERRDALESRDLLAVAEAILMGKDLGKPIPAATLEELKLSTRVINALKKNDVMSPLQLTNLASTGEDALLALTGIGPKAVEEITAALEAAKLQLQPITAEAVTEETTPATEPTAAKEAEAEEPITEEPSEVIEKAEALVAETPPAEEMPVVEVESPAEVEEEPEPEKVPPEADEAVSKVVDDKEGPSIFRIVGGWDEEEEEASDTDERSKKGKKKRKRLVYDEDLGEVVARRKRKPGRQRENWEDYA
jgi:N utilization substance protein A